MLSVVLGCPFLALWLKSLLTSLNAGAVRNSSSEENVGSSSTHCSAGAAAATDADDEWRLSRPRAEHRPTATTPVAASHNDNDPETISRRPNYDFHFYL